MDVVATGAVAGRIVITGVADTNETMAIGEATVTVAGVEPTEAMAG